MPSTTSRRKGTVVVVKGKQNEPEKEDMEIQEVKENESGLDDVNMVEKNEEESPNKNCYNVEIETKESNKSVKDRKIENKSKNKHSTPEFAKTGIKRKIEQLEESAAKVCAKKTTNEKADPKEKDIIFHKVF